jgi:replication factor A1
MCFKWFETHRYSYLLGLQVSDHTAQAWLQAFNDVGAEIIGKSADELMKIKVC